MSNETGKMRAQGGKEAETAYDGVAVARHLLRVIRAGALATLDRESGHPFASLVTVATDHDGAPLFLLSTLSGHTANLEADPRASVLLAERGKGDPLAHPRLTVIGTLARTGTGRAEADDRRARARFLARHPKAKLYAGFSDFSLWRMEVARAHLNGGFARAMAVEARDLLTPLAGAEALIAAEAGALAHLDEDHRDALALLATRIAKSPQADWRASGIDPEGLDLIAGDLTARVAFPERVSDEAGLRRVLVAMVERAPG